LEAGMKVERAAFVGVVIAVSLGAAGAFAAPMTIYDPASRTFMTYDPDKVRGDALARAPAGRTMAPVIQYAKPDDKFDRQPVAYDGPEEPGTIVIDTAEKFLYYVQEDGQAIRMGVGVGREGFGWTGVVHVGSKQAEPKWFPPKEMVERQPELAKYTGEGMPGGEGNPLGARALYLYDDNGKDTLYRIHGTIEPNSIGHNVSSGCIRMLNENVIELFELVPVGTKVIVL
jgi:lipoprotein-anchoring transpeptidase ErfK/SrfK